jgi:glycosyltransferase involved in cell wall biosynthesis
MCAVTFGPSPSILGISFDGLAISGVVNEFLSAAQVVRGYGFRVLLDLGYDITFDRTKDLGSEYLPSWVQPVRCIGRERPISYTPQLIRQARNRVIAGTSIAEARIYDDLVRDITSSLVEVFIHENVRLLIVENGTLPDNPLFTEAIFLAIVTYGKLRQLGKYVLWRDHDLMWSTEPHLYGGFPYPGVRRPEPSEYIHYAVTTDWMRKRMLAWAPDIACKVMPCRFVSPGKSESVRQPLRSNYDIPKDAYLIARCTRVIPQKSIERDLRLLHDIQLHLAASGNLRKVFLLVAGLTQEDSEEFEKLRSLEQSLSISGQVVWADGLLPFHTASITPATQTNQFSIRDLLAEADLSSFLTTYDYEGFGMPPGESMAMGVPFISTTYELYHEVYGSKGAVAPLLSIDRASSANDPIPEAFIAWTMRALMEDDYREEIKKINLEVVRRFFSLDLLEKELCELFDIA